MAKNISISQTADSIRAIIQQAKNDMTVAGKQIMIKAYWDIGKCMDNSECSGVTIRTLAAELEMEYSILHRCMMFYKQWPKACPENKNSDFALGWGHYRLLITEKDNKRRHQFEQKARRQKWSSARLKQHMKSDTAGDEFEPADPGTTLNPSTSMLFTYGARIIKIVDGDTLELMIDLGFDVWKEHRIRLRGINTAEIETNIGLKAKQFVEQQLNNCEMVVVKTSRAIDIYGRYIGDIFYKEGETNRDDIITKGSYLNNELLAQGLAELY